MKKYVLAIVDKGDYFVTEGFYHDSPMVKKPLTKEEFIDIRSFSYFPDRFFSFGCFKDYIGKLAIVEVETKPSILKSNNGNAYMEQVRMVREVKNPIELAVKLGLSESNYPDFVNFNMVNSKEEYDLLLPKLIEHKKGPIWGDSIYLLKHNRYLFLRLVKEHAPIALVMYNYRIGRDTTGIEWLMKGINASDYAYLLELTHYSLDELYEAGKKFLTVDFYNKYTKPILSLKLGSGYPNDGYYYYPEGSDFQRMQLVEQYYDESVLALFDFDAFFAEIAEGFHYCLKTVEYAPAIEEIYEDYYDDFDYEDDETYEEYVERHTYVTDERDYEIGYFEPFFKYLTDKSLPYLSLVDEELLLNLPNHLKEKLNLSE